MNKKLSIEYREFDITKQTIHDLLLIMINVTILISIITIAGKIYVNNIYSQDNRLHTYTVESLTESDSTTDKVLTLVMSSEPDNSICYITDYKYFSIGEHLLMYTDRDGKPLVSFEEAVMEMLKSPIIAYIFLMYIIITVVCVLYAVQYYRVRSEVLKVLKVATEHNIS